jgi:D-glycero-D-manno-heptose 1,7-bisphosphate phosphatase
MNYFDVLCDLNGVLIENNKSLGTGDIVDNSLTGKEVAQKYKAGELPAYYYTTNPEEVVFRPGALMALMFLNQCDRRVFMITNQEVVGIGGATEIQMSALFDYIDDIVEKAGGHIDEWYMCPHAPDDGCECRKPKPGLLLLAAQDYGIKLDRAYMIGDNPTDIGAGKAAGCKTIHIPLPLANSKNRECESDFKAGSLLEAVEIILAEEGIMSELPLSKKTREAILQIPLPLPHTNSQI